MKWHRYTAMQPCNASTNRCEMSQITFVCIEFSNICCSAKFFPSSPKCVWPIFRSHIFVVAGFDFHLRSFPRTKSWAHLISFDTMGANANRARLEWKTAHEASHVRRTTHTHTQQPPH